MIVDCSSSDVVLAFVDLSTSGVDLELVDFTTLDDLEDPDLTIVDVSRVMRYKM